MRSHFLLLLMTLPVMAGAQVNRSAKELASESVQAYITGKLFKNMPYKSITFGEIKEAGIRKKDVIVWSIVHKFEITEDGKGSFGSSPESRKEYRFLFYLDDKMKVIKADTWYSH
ncbi:MAG: hypothetical protein JNK14_03490 [Chitinophagaceae bacterium]|nr:hypothetical protein [Chitinophagaceae bacterium]